MLFRSRAFNRVFEDSVFPLLPSNAKPTVELNDLQQEKIRAFIGKINSKDYQLRANGCLCGNEHKSKAVVIGEIDKHGIPIRNLLCRHCSLIRSEQVLEVDSMAQFYKDEYHEMYFGSKEATDEYFLRRLKRGVEIVQHLGNVGILDDIVTVFEVGCGSGGVLYPFHLIGKMASGSDFGEKYLDFGRKWGLELYQGEINDTHTPDSSQDLVLLCHVMEHFIDPIQEMNRIITKVKPGKYCLVEVPCMSRMIRNYSDPIIYLQNAHVFNFNFEYLKVYFQSLGLTVLSGNTDCTFVLRKPEDWSPRQVNSIWDEILPSVAEEIQYRMARRHLLGFC